MKRGKRFVFHGAFGTKARAVKKERKVKGAFVRKKHFRGRGTRWMVLTRKKR